MDNNIPLVTIGVPVFNGEKIIKKRLESIINQTYQNFEVIISDNASTDGTSELCEQFIDKKNYIKFFKQKKNIGFIENFNFLIKKANGKYFTIAAVDDGWEPDFLEKNLEILESNEKIVGSIGEVKYFGDATNKNNSSKISQFLKKIVRRQNVNTLEKHVISVSGKFNEKVDKYLRFNQGSFVYGVFRTKNIQKNSISGPLMGWDLAFILNILKFGDLHVIDKVLFHKYAGGLSNKGIIESYKRHEIPFYDMIIPYFSLFNWAWKNIGVKFCIRNIDWFFILSTYTRYAMLKKL